MILTVTLNASIDITYMMKELRLGVTNRVSNIAKTAGGKGLNVSRVLAQTKASVLATGLVGGMTGAQIEESLNSLHIDHRFAHIEGASRNNITIVCRGASTEILEAGASVQPSEREPFLELFDELAEAASVIVLSGSIPGGLPPSFYAELIARSRARGAKPILDASGERLRSALTAPVKPYMIKPNIYEIKELLELECSEEYSEQLASCLDDPLFDGIDVVLVSLGAHGALMRCNGEVWRGTGPLVQVKNATGSGDALVAGFARVIDEGGDPLLALRTGMTYGALNARDSMPGRLRLDEYEQVYEAVHIDRLQ